MNDKQKDILLEEIRQKSELEVWRLSREFVHAASEEKEAIMAAMEFENWLADSCGECLAGR